MKRVLSLLLSVIIIVSSFSAVSGLIVGAASKTGIGLSEWAMRAYNEGWSYVYGGASVGKVDCSGLVYAYAGGYHASKKMLANYASSKGAVSSGIPRIHGLVLYAAPTSSSSVAHMGVYVGKDENGNDMAVDARSSSIGVVYKTVASRTKKPWVTWFKHSKLSYPTNGWYTYNGKKYYYSNGQFVVGKFTVDGVTYDFGKSGALKGNVSSSGGETVKTTTTTQKAVSTSLKYGSKGEAVTKLQKRLIELGYLSGSADGTYGNKTVEAVKNFQKRVGIAADGIAGTTTQKKLYASDAPKAPATTTTTTTVKKTTTTTKTTAQPKKTTTTTTTVKKKDNGTPSSKYATLTVGDKGDAVYQLQHRLTMLGYLKTKYDGTFGNITAAAVKQFQQKAGLTADGVATAQTQERLFATNAPWAGEASAKAADTEKPAADVPDDTAGDFDIMRIRDESDAVAMLQERLAELGYFNQEATGYFGAFTFDAVIMFQVNAGLSADGIVGEETFNAIYSDNAVKADSSLMETAISDSEDEDIAKYLGEKITVEYNGETFIINQAISELIDNSVFM